MTQEQQLLGELKGKSDMTISHLQAINDKLDSIDKRLRPLEGQAKLHGAVAGGIFGLGTALLAEKLKKMLGV